MTLAEKLVRLRKAAGVSRSELARTLTRISHTSVSRAAVSAWESGTRTPHRGTMELLADYFDVDVGYLLGVQPKTQSDYPEVMAISEDAKKMTNEERARMLLLVQMAFPKAF